MCHSMAALLVAVVHVAAAAVVLCLLLFVPDAVSAALCASRTVLMLLTSVGIGLCCVLHLLAADSHCSCFLQMAIVVVSCI